MNTMSKYCESKALKASPCPAVEATRTMVITTIGLAFVGGVLACFAEHADGKIDKSAPAIMFFVGAGLTIIGWIVWIASVEASTIEGMQAPYEEVVKTMGYSQILVIMSWLCLLAGGVFALIIPNEIIGKIVPHH